MNPLTYVIINGAVVVLVWTGAIRVNSGYITQGEVVAHGKLYVPDFSRTYKNLLTLLLILINLLRVETAFRRFLNYSHPSQIMR